MKCLRHSLLACSLALVSSSAYSIIPHPFTDNGGCPSDAFLFQGNPTSVVYQIDLSSGFYHNSDPMTTSVNAVGYNESDAYIYGFDIVNVNVVRVNQLFQSENVAVTGLPSGQIFNTGDVYNNKYYLYSTNDGLWEVDLTTLVATQVMSSGNANVSLTDMAFHPAGGGRLFAVDNDSKKLYEIINYSTASATFNEIGDTNISGSSTFGAQYFDSSGYMYLSRNQDGLVFQLDLTDLASLNPVAVQYSSGPESDWNDGARCANAPILAANTDFGDAPDTYKTALTSNGARHYNISEVNYFFGSEVDTEGAALISPNSDDADGTPNDEDGISFPANFKQGSDALIQVSVGGSAPGYVNAWIDWNDNGVFDESTEHAITDELLAGGDGVTPATYLLKVRVPDDAATGQLWARFRISKDTGTLSYGGVSYGEVEDHQVTVDAQTVTHNWYPSSSSWVTLVYEDDWPQAGDFDFNDVALYYRVDTVKDAAGDILRYDIYGSLRAYGADFANGFAVKFDGIATGAVDSDRTKLVINGSTLHTTQILESGTTDAVAIISNNLKTEITAPTCSGTLGSYYRVWTGCSDDATDQFVFEASIPFTTPIAAASGPSMPLNPFIFGTPGIDHGDGTRASDGRAIEIHLKNHDVTSKANTALFATDDDTSAYVDGDCPGVSCDTYHNTNGVPWAIAIDVPWDHPSEGTNILDAYPDLSAFATSGGSTNTDWYLRANAVVSKLFE
ncbi:MULTISPECIES: LruC domain-containing protein [unclassified Photobacterium]|uniref:LruC domain-containing protein n=1 Tax=unclassified Photobacterium TaxID=2628852 RepID=UPI001EE02F26|nr:MULTISPECIES: LruC domain-containing protein [unclassified Photobacterium]MCG3863673.1 LruC domain-containing protein [Photobacterium sp. Ph6]MCG3875227.1 LruC domain-containing protein [Photobacterium sp. Ph5]